ncbi:hypothetical protein TWF281_008934 [Arthrobotrys megalospora]
MQVLSILLVSLTVAQCTVIPETNVKLSLIKRAGPPKCPSNGGNKSPFFRTSLDIIKSYAGYAYNAAAALEELPDDLSGMGGDCRPRPNDGVNQNLYPRPADGSSDCPRRDQEIRRILYEDLVDNNNPSLLALISSQNPSNFPTDAAAIAKYCSDNTVTHAELRDALSDLRDAYFELLGEIEKQTCLIRLSPQSSTAFYIFNHPFADPKADTKVYGVLHAFNTIIAAAQYNGETFGPLQQGSIDAIRDDFTVTKNFIDVRSDCTPGAKALCARLGVPLKQGGLLSQVLGIVFGPPSNCPAVALTGENGGLLGAILG